MKRILLACPALAIAAPAGAVDVNLGVNLVNSCTLTLGSAGTMTPSADGSRIGSEESGGSAASLSLVAVGSNPTLGFAAPTLTSSPAGWSASPSLAIRYTSTRGASQAYTGSASSAPIGGLTDQFTIHGRISSTTGFAAGSYNLRTVVTCSQ